MLETIRVIWDEATGKEIEETNFWQSQAHAAGLFQLVANANIFHLLIPETHCSAVPEIQTGQRVKVEHVAHKQGAEVWVTFDDETAAPFEIRLDSTQALRLPGAFVGTKRYGFAAWVLGADGRPECCYRSDAYYRMRKAHD